MNFRCFYIFWKYVKQKKIKCMLRLKEIKRKIQFAQQNWAELEEEIAQSSLLTVKINISSRKEKLKNLLEEIRVNIEDLLNYSHCRSLVKVCKGFLEKILAISEKLRVSYVSPGYVESYYIYDTLKLTDRLGNC